MNSTVKSLIVYALVITVVALAVQFLPEVSATIFAFIAGWQIGNWTIAFTRELK